MTVASINLCKLKSDELLIKEYRAAAPKHQAKILNHFLKRKLPEKTSSWEIIMKKYVKWRLLRSRGAFDIYDEKDLYQRCLCCFYKAVSEKYKFDKDTKFSTYMYSALEKTINRVLVELRKKKRTLNIEGKRVSPRFFTDSLNQPINSNEKSMTLNEVIPDDSMNDDISEDAAIIADCILQKCKKYMTPMQYEIFVCGDIQGIVSGKDLAKKFKKSEPTISAIKKRKIARILSQIKNEVDDEFDLTKM